MITGGQVKAALGALGAVKTNDLVAAWRNRFSDLDADAVLAEDKMRLLLVIRALARRLATAQRDAETKGAGAENNAVPKFHDAKLNEFLPSCNCVRKEIETANFRD